LAQADRLGRLVRLRRREWTLPGQGTPAAIPSMLSVPYLGLLRFVSERSDPSVDSTQFMVAAMNRLSLDGRYGETGSGAVLLVSEFHRVVRPGDRSSVLIDADLLDRDAV
jgi:hypothetical protein